MSGMVRRCKKEDLETIIELSGYAYSIPEASFENFRVKWDDIYDEFFINEVDGVPVASARMIPLIQNIRGSMKNMGAIGLVAGSPEYRRKGHVRELMLKMLEDIRNRDYSVSCLYPFKDSFYSALDYVKLPPSKFLEFDPVHLRGIARPEGYKVGRETGDESFQVWRTLHDRMVDLTHGAARRRDVRWLEYTRNFKRKIVVARNKSGEANGVLVYSIKGYGEGHDWAETGEMRISDMYWKTLEARDSILNFIYGHTDQIKKVKIELNPLNEDYYHWLTDYHTPNISSNIVAMARIVDVEKCFNGLKVDTNGELILEIKDSQFEFNNGAFAFSVDDGRLQVESSNEKTDSSIDIQGLTAIVYGILGGLELRRMNWLSGNDIRQLELWFPRAVPWLSESF